MTPRTRRPILFRVTLILGAAAALVVATVHAQQAPEENFTFEIGHAAKFGTVYSIHATQPATSKLTGQKVRLKVVATTNFDRNTHYFTFATGKHKTVAQLDALLVYVFQRFLANPPPGAGRELGKIGDVQHGGEVRFVVTSTNVLRFDNISPDQPVRTSSYSREDVAGLLAALAGPAPI